MNDHMTDIFATFPELETDRLLLRQVRQTDAEDIFAIFGDDAVTEYYDLETFQGLDDAYEIIDYFDESFFTERQIRWGIERKSDERLIGTCGFVSMHKHRAEIGYDLARDCWRAGYMVEALEAVLELSFDEIGLIRVEALVMLDNRPSANLLRALGFSEEGVLRQYDFFKGAFHDLRSFSILADEYAAMYS